MHLATSALLSGDSVIWVGQCSDTPLNATRSEELFYVPTLSRSGFTVTVGHQLLIKTLFGGCRSCKSLS